MKHPVSFMGPMSIPMPLIIIKSPVRIIIIGIIPIPWLPPGAIVVPIMPRINATRILP
jgi:hypothetical protein